MLRPGRQAGRRTNPPLTERTCPRRRRWICGWLRPYHGLTVTNEKTYEMLWDCRYCGTRKLLGKTHRHCPQCGGEQDASARYFPSDAEKVAVEDHAYVGADLVCGSCGYYNSRAARCCGNCGGPLDPNRVAAVRRDQEYTEGQVYAGETAQNARQEFRTGQAGPVPVGGLPTPPTGNKPKSKAVWWALGCGGAAILVAVVVGLVAWLLRSEDTSVTVTAMGWQRTIEVERKSPVERKGWCDEMPRGARELGRAQAQRGTEKVQNGEECRIRKVDRGNGTFAEKRTCTPRYENKPRYADQCRFVTNEWKTVRTERAQGGVGTAPTWPSVSVGRTGDCVGCERIGARKEQFTVSIKDPAGSTRDCALPQGRFATLRVGQTLKAKRTVIGQLLDCDSLAP